MTKQMSEIRDKLATEHHLKYLPIYSVQVDGHTPAMSFCDGFDQGVLEARKKIPQFSNNKTSLNMVLELESEILNLESALEIAVLTMRNVCNNIFGDCTCHICRTLTSIRSITGTELTKGEK